MTTFGDDAVAAHEPHGGGREAVREGDPRAPRLEAEGFAAAAGFDAAAALEALGAGVVRVGSDWRVGYVSALAARLLGARAVSLVGRHAGDALAPLLGGREVAERAAHQTMADGHPRSFRVARTVAGRDEVLDVRVGRDAGGGLVLELRDATGAALLERELEREERELAERVAENEALRELARAMAAVPDSSALLQALCDRAQVHCRATGALVAQFRPSPADPNEEQGVVVAATGRNQALRGSAFPLADTLIQRAARERSTIVAAGRDTRSAYFRSYNTTNDVGPLMLTPLVAHDQVLGVLSVSRTSDLAPFSMRDGERLRVIADHASLALWKARLFEEAQAANQAKSNFLATMSHELRTPLAALTGYGELLADDILGPLTKPQHEVVERMRTVTAQLTTMIDEVLTYTSLDVGRERVRRRPVDPPAVLRSAAAAVEPLAHQKELEFAVAVPPYVPTVNTDPDKVRQILVNLAGNAVKFTDRGSVFLSVAEEGGELHFRVRDTGCGIAHDDRGRLFHPFSQLDDGLTRRHGGTGLGLYISRRLAELLGGRIELESVPGNGSTFELVLPVR